MKKLKRWLLNLWRRAVPTTTNRNNVDRVVVTDEIQPSLSGKPDIPKKPRKM